MAKSVLSAYVLPLVVFPLLSALAFNFIFGHLFASGLSDKIAAECPPNEEVVSTDTTPYLLPYTGYHAVDSSLCGMVVFFHATMSSATPLNFLTYFIGVGAPFIAIPAVEASRTTGSRFIAYPVVWALLSQTATIGFSTPMYWLVFILTGGLQRFRKRGESLVTQAHAEAIVFGVIIGAAIPSVGMLVLDDPYVTALWQPYPVFVSVAQAAHLFFRPPSSFPQSGYRTIQALYIGAFIISSSVHISTVLPLLPDYDALKNLFLPSVAVLDSSTEMALQTFDFLKWDFVFGFASTIIATMWFATNFKQLLGIIAWYMVAVPVLGPGAAVLGVALWRESNLESPTYLETNKQK
ncbi:hypothetical protein BDQ12DRAFT_676778 [Crucibulum laeve]|uniref:Uncharacterized protein n=1 Tax=Crucibulum laeve TaxID=68775 RepID=A0A5C3MNL4_9AGAR|nr:hypothetical protein BDQ12DRAFT_676778 [Crucibulum laeve]